MLDTNLRKGELKMKDKIFGVLQRVGRSFMLPIALLPVAGLLLGIGSSFTNETMLAAYGLNSVIHPGTLIYTILDVMSQTGSAVFNNLALLFAMGVAIGMARKEKEVAALSGAVAYIIMNTDLHTEYFFLAYDRSDVLGQLSHTLARPFELSACFFEF